MIFYFHQKSCIIFLDDGVCNCEIWFGRRYSVLRRKMPHLAQHVFSTAGVSWNDRPARSRLENLSGMAEQIKSQLGNQ